MITKLAKDIFDKETMLDSVKEKIIEYVKANPSERKTVYTNLVNELMKLKKNSVYLKSDRGKREIIAEIQGELKFINTSAVQHEVLFIIGKTSTDVNSILATVNQIADNSNSVSECYLGLEKLQKKLLKENTSVKFRHDFPNTKHISTLVFEKHQGETVQTNQSIGYFEDHEFTNTAMDYMMKCRIVEEYCRKMLTTPQKAIEKNQEQKKDKDKTLKEIWLGSDAQYDELLELLQQEITLPLHTPELTISFLKRDGNNNFRWVKKPTSGWQRYMSGLLRNCGEYEFINLDNFGASTLRTICKNTFLETTDKMDDDAFAEMDLLKDKYLEAFKPIMDKIN